MQAVPALGEVLSMFTGIVEELGRVRRVASSASNGKMVIGAEKVLEGTQIGDSIAVNGVCLTVVSLGRDEFSADVMPQTLRSSGLGQLKPGDLVDLERAMPADGRFGGHIVSGHIDGTGTIESVRNEGNAVVVEIRAPQAILDLVVEKGLYCQRTLHLLFSRHNQVPYLSPNSKA